MKTKRMNVFETNSSSVHTITLDGSCCNDLRVKKDGYVHLKIHDFGKDYRRYTNAKDKLLYAILTVCYTRNIWLDSSYEYDEEDESQEFNSYWDDCIEELRDTEEFQSIERCVIEFLSNENKQCKGIKIHRSDGCIDHQSQKYDSLNDFLYYNNLSDIKEFIFGSAVLHTDCD